MKSRSSEVLILLVLILILAGYAGVHYLIKPLRAQIERTEQSITLKENEIKTMYYTVTAYSSKCAYLNQLSEGLAPYAERFYAAEDEENYLDHVRVNVKDCRVEFSSLAAEEGHIKTSSYGLKAETGAVIYEALGSEEKVSALKQDKFVQYYKKFLEKDSRLEKDVQTVSFTLEAFGSYRQILSFLEGLMKDGRSVIVNSMTLDIAENISLSASNDPEARLVVTLVFVEIPGVEEMSQIAEAEELLPYAFPQDILNGSYRSADGLLSALLMKLVK